MGWTASASILVKMSKPHGARDAVRLRTREKVGARGGAGVIYRSRGRQSGPQGSSPARRSRWLWELARALSRSPEWSLPVPRLRGSFPAHRSRWPEEQLAARRCGARGISPARAGGSPCACRWRLPGQSSPTVAPSAATAVGRARRGYHGLLPVAVRRSHGGGNRREWRTCPYLKLRARAGVEEREAGSVASSIWPARV